MRRADVEIAAGLREGDRLRLALLQYAGVPVALGRGAGRRAGEGVGGGGGATAPPLPHSERIPPPHRGSRGAGGGRRGGRPDRPPLLPPNSPGGGGRPQPRFGTATILRRS